MHCLPSLILAATLGSFVAPVIAGNWWLIGSQQSFCRITNDGDTHYNWSGDDTNCHSFPNSESACGFATADGDAFSTVNCEADHPNYIQSFSYQNGEDNAGLGCMFFEDRNCQGESLTVTNADLISQCFEFYSWKSQSFRCH